MITKCYCIWIAVILSISLNCSLGGSLRSKHQSDDGRTKSFPQSLASSYESCPTFVHDAIQSLLMYPESLLIPFGRAYLAQIHGIALIADAIEEYLSSSPPYLQINVRPCSLTNTPKDPDISCDISLYARMVGPAIHMGQLEVRQTTGRNVSQGTVARCEWSFKFYPFAHPGSYTLELFAHYLNEMDEPDEASRTRLKSFRSNDGHSICLSGLGLHPVFISNASLSYFDFEGQIVSQTGSKALYLIVNGKRSRFGSWDQFVGLGFDSSDVVVISDRLMAHFPGGGDLPLASKLPEPTTVDKQEKHERQHYKNLKAKLPVGKKYENFTAVAKEMSTYRPLTVDNFSRRQSAIFHRTISSMFEVFPSVIVKEYEQNQVTVDRSTLPLCGRGDHPGNWVNGDKPSRFYSHATPPQFGPDYYLYKMLGGRHYTWQPRDCRLVHFYRDHENTCINTKQAFLSNLRSFAHQTAASLNKNNISSEGDVYCTKSLAEYSLMHAGIGAVIGFGDSLGNEIYNSILNQLDVDKQLIGHCRFNLKRIFALKSDEAVNPLIQCINFTAASIPMTSHAILSPYQSRHTGSLITTTHTAETLQKNESYPLKSIVLVTNFNCHGAIAMHSLDDIAKSLHLLAVMHEELAAYLQSFVGHDGQPRSLIYRRIFYSCVAIHGFRAAGLTSARAKWFNAKASEVLGNKGWEILDAFNITLPRPDGSVDGLHYSGGVSHAITEVLLTMLTSNASQQNNFVTNVL